MAVPGGLFRHDPFTGKRAGDEHSLAITSRHATAIVAVVDDLGFKGGLVDARGAGSCHVAGAACGCGAVLSQMAGNGEWGMESSMAFDLPLWKRGIEGDLLLLLGRIKSKSPVAPFCKGGKSKGGFRPLPCLVAISASSPRPNPGTTSRHARWRSTAGRRSRGFSLPTPGGRWRPRLRDTPPCDRGCRRPPPG